MRTVVGIERMGEYYLRNLAGNPFETSLAISRVLFGGVLDEYPGLKFLFSHGGGTVPYVIGRMDHGYFQRDECKERIKKPSSAYLTSLYFDTIVFEKRILQFLVEIMGPEHLMLGSDYPFEMREFDLLNSVDSIRDLSRVEKDCIKGGNAMRLLNLSKGGS